MDQRLKHIQKELCMINNCGWKLIFINMDLGQCRKDGYFRSQYKWYLPLKRRVKMTQYMFSFDTIGKIWTKTTWIFTNLFHRFVLSSIPSKDKGEKNIPTWQAIYTQLTIFKNFLCFSEKEYGMTGYIKYPGLPIWSALQYILERFAKWMFQIGFNSPGRRRKVIILPGRALCDTVQILLAKEEKF